MYEPTTAGVILYGIWTLLSIALTLLFIASHDFSTGDYKKEKIRTSRSFTLSPVREERSGFEWLSEE